MLCRLLILAIAASHYLQASGATFSIMPEAGLMQQPASQYYLFVRGGALQVGTDSDSFHATFRYLARPVFEQNGFSESEDGLFALIGTKLDAFDKGPLQLKASMGYGQMRGEIAKDGQHTGYRMHGLALEVSAVLRLKFFELRTSHMTFLGYADAFQTEKRVLWPFQFFLLGAGVAL